MTIQQLEAFVLLAATLNYTKASMLLNMTQPNLSKLVNSIEQELGVQLVSRNFRTVKLTPAGKAFCESAKKILEVYAAAEVRVKDIDADCSGALSIGYLSAAMVNHMPKLVRRFKEAYPDISLRLYDHTISPLLSALIDNHVDIAMLPDRQLDGVPKLEKKPLYADDMCVVLPKDHPLNTGNGVELIKFARTPFVMIDPKTSFRDYDWTYSICKANGFNPRVSQAANSFNNLLQIIECGYGVSILARHMQHLATNNLDFISIKGCEKSFKMVSVWRRDQNPHIEKFNTIIDECFNNN